MPPWAWIALAVDLAPAVGRRRGRERRRLGEPLGVGVGRPGGEVRGRARALGVQQHLRAAVRDGLEGADRDAELLAVLDVLERHLERALADADDLGGEIAARTRSAAPAASGSPIAAATAA